jgi:hypothetical protein
MFRGGGFTSFYSCLSILFYSPFLVVVVVFGSVPRCSVGLYWGVLYHNIREGKLGKNGKRGGKRDGMGLELGSGSGIKRILSVMERHFMIDRMGWDGIGVASFITITITVIVTVIVILTATCCIRDW